MRNAVVTVLLIVLTMTVTARAALIEGTIRDAVSGEPISRVTIRIEGTGRTMLGNDDGRYRLRLDPGTYTLRFSHVAHYSKTIDLKVADRPETLDVVLPPSIIELPGTKVYTRAYDPAQRIIVEAILHKKELLEKIHDYSFEAYTKLTVRKREDTAAGNFLLITETQLKGFFETPDHFKEFITARKQSSNLDAEGNLVTVGRMFNFNENRIDIGRQAVVTPTATDALDFYNYYLLDTTLVEGRPAFRLEIEPKSDADPLFAGEILIADSTYEVVGVNVTLNKGFDAPLIKNTRFSQRLARFDSDIWWPVEVRFSGDISIPIPGLPDMTFNYVAALNRMVFNRGIPERTFDEFVLEVDPMADDIDSTTWAQGELIPLTGDEKLGYQHIDSVENRTSVRRMVLMAVAGAVYLTESPAAYDFFHFNGVEGIYLGAGYTFRNLLPRTDLYLKSGWAFGGEYWQHHYRLSHLFTEHSRLQFSGGFHDEIVPRPTMFVNHHFNPTLVDLLARINPLDYYLEKGFDVEAGISPVRHVRLYAGYHDLNQYRVANVRSLEYRTEYFRDSTITHVYRQPNPPIVNGHLRSVDFRFVYDSRPLIKSKRRIDTVIAVTATRVDAGLETATPDLIENDFDYRRYYLKLKHRQRLPGLGITSLFAYGGLSDRALPPQSYFTIDIGDQDNMQSTGFKTLEDKNFVGDRVLALYVSHNFGLTLFRKSGLPLIRKLPLTLSIYGGTFWSDFRQASLKVDGFPVHIARDGYSEIGFGIGRIPPIFLQFYFTWQLSAYDTRDFSVKFALGF